MGIFHHIYHMLSHFLWGNTMLAAFFAIGLSYTIQTNFFQFKHIKLWLLSTVGSITSSKQEGKELSPFEAVSAALAGSMGIGNIVGVATALTSGGPGAIFWLWVSALFGSMTKYAEIVLGFRYRYKDKEGNQVGGPMIYLREGLKSPVLSFFFSVVCAVGSFTMGNMTQGNSIAEVLSYTFSIPPLFTGFLFAVLIALVIIGGIKRIGKLSSVLIPFMSVLYIAICLIVIGANIERVPVAFQSIFTYAFRLKPVLGGMAGYHLRNALKVGVMRSVFSNEAGIGSSVIAHIASSAENGVEQGMWGIFEVFVDTIVVCTLTALVLLTSGVYDIKLYSAMQGKGILPDGATLATEAFSSVLGNFGQVFLAFATVIFGFATILAWSQYGEQCVIYLLGKKFIYPYRVLYVICVLLGCVMRMDIVWKIADNINALMAIPNLIALLFLSQEVIKETKQYLTKIKVDERVAVSYNKKANTKKSEGNT